MHTDSAKTWKENKSISTTAYLDSRHLPSRAIVPLIMHAIAIASLIPIFLLSCSLSCSRSKEPLPVEESETFEAIDSIDMPKASSTAAMSARVPDARPRQQPACPEGMVEVKGNYCPTVLHHCVEGGKTYDGKPSKDSNPYYCTAYRPGYAKCFGEEVPKHFCIDIYEFPNQKGALPRVFVSWYEAKEECEKQGKRLCGDDEWTLACEGPERMPYPYGWRRDDSLCNIDKRWIKPNDGILASKVRDERVEEELRRLSQAVRSGDMPRCISAYGVVDMGGNVDEWAVNVTLGGKPYQSIFKGGHWCGGARNRCRPTTESHNETTRYYSQGFRCCKDSIASAK